MGELLRLCLELIEDNRIDSIIKLRLALLSETSDAARMPFYDTIIMELSKFYNVKGDNKVAINQSYDPCFDQRLVLLSDVIVQQPCSKEAVGRVIEDLIQCHSNKPRLVIVKILKAIEGKLNVYEIIMNSVGIISQNDALLNDAFRILINSVSFDQRVLLTLYKKIKALELENANISAKNKTMPPLAISKAIIGNKNIITGIISMMRKIMNNCPTVHYNLDIVIMLLGYTSHQDRSIIAKEIFKKEDFRKVVGFGSLINTLIKGKIMDLIPYTFRHLKKKDLKKISDSNAFMVAVIDFKASGHDEVATIGSLVREIADSRIVFQLTAENLLKIVIRGYNGYFNYYSSYDPNFKDEESYNAYCKKMVEIINGVNEKAKPHFLEELLYEIVNHFVYFFNFVPLIASKNLDWDYVINNKTLREWYGSYQNTNYDKLKKVFTKKEDKKSNQKRT